MFATDDTIVAIATPPGRGAIGVVRLSGADAARVAMALVDRERPLESRHASLARIVRRGGTARAIDRVIVTWFPAPASYTGEDVVEIGAHGSPVLLGEIVEACVAAGARRARPGEFTLRAFLNGRVDLVQAEAVADLVDAVTRAQARQAFDQLEGTLTRAIGAIADALFDLIARLEASVDFPDEGYHFVGAHEAGEAIEGVVRQVDALLDRAAAGRLIREGAHGVILGRTNAGKSSLFNYLLGSCRAIVTMHAGTTRDLITERTDVLGVPVTLVDTAGLGGAIDEVEREGVARAREAGAVADVAIVVLDRSVPLEQADREMLAATAASPRVVVINKCDLPAAWPREAIEVDDALEISLLTGAGGDAVRPALYRALTARDPSRETSALSNARHIERLRAAKAALDEAAARAAEATPEEFVLADLQRARVALEEITGHRTPEDVLAHIFERFCIGK